MKTETCIITKTTFRVLDIGETILLTDYITGNLNEPGSGIMQLPPSANLHDRPVPPDCLLRFLRPLTPSQELSIHA